jgi:hypothetical protein
MHYIIDANNLAGKLKMLGEESFDKKLIALVKKFNREKQRKITLVFDSNDPLGDKQEAGDNITAIYSPKDKYYQSADDKIVELVRNKTTSDAGHPTSDVLVTLVTEDRELIKRAEKLLEDGSNNVTIQSTTLFVEKLKKALENDNDEDGDRKLSDEEVNKINQEMLKYWQ